MRTKNSKNKPKTFPITLQILIDTFKPETEILVDVCYLHLLKDKHNSIPTSDNIIPIQVTASSADFGKIEIKEVKLQKK